MNENVHRIKNQPSLFIAMDGTITCEIWCICSGKISSRLPLLIFGSIPEKANKLVTELGNPLILPILEINGIYYEKPPFSEVREVLDQSRLRQRVDQTYNGKKRCGHINYGY